MANGVSGREVQSTDGQVMQGVGGMETLAGGDTISGRWFNLQTGLEVNVLRTIDTGNGMSIVTDKGVMSGEQFCSFVQMDAQQPTVGSNMVKPVDNQQINLSGLDDADKALISQATGQRNVSLDKPLTKQVERVHETQQSKKESDSPNFKIIDKLFNKFSEKSPIVKVQIDWGDFPREQLTNLTEIFDVPKNEIAEYMIKKFLSTENIKDIMIEKI